MEVNYNRPSEDHRDAHVALGENEKGEHQNNTHNDFEIVTGDDSVSVFDPLDGGSWGARDLALEDDVHGLVSVGVGRTLDELRRNCGEQEEEEVTFIPSLWNSDILSTRNSQ